MKCPYCGNEENLHYNYNYEDKCSVNEILCNECGKLFDPSHQHEINYHKEEIEKDYKCLYSIKGEPLVSQELWDKLGDIDSAENKINGIRIEGIYGINNKEALDSIAEKIWELDALFLTYFGRGIEKIKVREKM